jgi:hypothetical protein
MFENTIEFIAPKDFVELNLGYPKPVKLNIPEWFKKLEHTPTHKTVKGCMPFLDALTTGYVLELPQDVLIQHNIPNKEGVPSYYAQFALYEENLGGHNKLNINDANYGSHSMHNSKQIAGSPLESRNKFLPIHKFFNPWKIVTPKGYSCLFIPPLNNRDDRFEIIAGIVDTDTYHQPVNFPFIINGDKYPEFNDVIKKGTPYVQIIPFKREAWKMKIHSKNPSKKLTNIIFNSTLLHKYRNLFWHKKTWT